MVSKGQKIAGGSSDADRVQLYFEIRQNGRPLDPLACCRRPEERICRVRSILWRHAGVQAAGIERLRTGTTCSMPRCSARTAFVDQVVRKVSGS